LTPGSTFPSNLASSRVGLLWFCPGNGSTSAFAFPKDLKAVEVVAWTATVSGFPEALGACNVGNIVGVGLDFSRSVMLSVLLAVSFSIRLGHFHCRPSATRRLFLPLTLLLSLVVKLVQLTFWRPSTCTGTLGLRGASMLGGNVHIGGGPASRTINPAKLGWSSMITSRAKLRGSQGQGKLRSTLETVVRMATFQDAANATVYWTSGPINDRSLPELRPMEACHQGSWSSSAVLLCVCVARAQQTSGS